LWRFGANLEGCKGARYLALVLGKNGRQATELGLAAVPGRRHLGAIEQQRDLHVLFELLGVSRSILNSLRQESIQEGELSHGRAECILDPRFALRVIIVGLVLLFAAVIVEMGSQRGLHYSQAKVRCSAVDACLQYFLIAYR
jgi:hypothetical protein